AARKAALVVDMVGWFPAVDALVVLSAVSWVVLDDVLKVRARPDEDAEGPPIHGHAKLEVWWTAIPAVLVTAISSVSAIVLAQNSNAGSNPVKIGVLGRQFAWQFSYSNGQKLGYLEVPLNRKVQLDITASDVLHSIWV